MLFLTILLVTLVILNGCGGDTKIKPDPPRGSVAMIVKWENVTPNDLAAENPNYQGADRLFFDVMVYKQISATNDSGVYNAYNIPLKSEKTLENCIIGEGSIAIVSIIAASLGDHVIVAGQKTLNIKDRLYVTVSRGDNGFSLDVNSE